MNRQQPPPPPPQRQKPSPAPGAAAPSSPRHSASTAPLSAASAQAGASARIEPTASQSTRAAPPSGVVAAQATASSSTVSSAALQPALSPENLGIYPVGSQSNDPSFGFEWKPRRLGTNHSWGCAVCAVGDAALTVHVTQLPYNRTLKGVGSLEVVAIPVAPSGSRGTLSVRNDSTGATAEFAWTWGPFNEQHRAPRAKTLPSKPSSQLAGVVPEAAGAQVSKVKRPITDSRVATDTQAGSAIRARADAVAQRAGTTAAQGFFGMAAAGGRVAFVLDMSGSMEGPRWEACKTQLGGVLAGLREGLEFYVVLFSDTLATPPGQEGWTPLSPESLASVAAWLEGVSPNGGTDPRPAFEQLYSLAAAPTTVFFLTDGQFFGFTAEDCARIQGGGGSSARGGGGLLNALRSWFSGPAADEPASQKAVINTITLDDASSSSVMQEIAANSGGQYVHASSE